MPCSPHGGRVTGVIPASMVDRELAHRGLTDLRIVGSMHERKALMASLADAFLVLPGGMGTLDELCEILTWAQLGLHAKPVGAARRPRLLARLPGLPRHRRRPKASCAPRDRARLRCDADVERAGRCAARGGAGAGMKSAAGAAAADLRCAGSSASGAGAGARARGRPPRPRVGASHRAIAAPLAPRLVRHPRARQYVLRVLPDGTPRVTIPRWGSKREALAFLEAQRDWVARQRAKQAERARVRAVARLARRPRRCCSADARSRCAADRRAGPASSSEDDALDRDAAAARRRRSAAGRLGLAAGARQARAAAAPAGARRAVRSRRHARLGAQPAGALGLVRDRRPHLAQLAPGPDAGRRSATTC